MTAKTLMVQGTGSSVGKSVLVTALCRIFKQQGLSVAPFKAQNMSLNSFVTLDGDEIGRAQAVQAEASGVPATIDMNPVLLKPEADNCSQIIVAGKPLTRVSATDFPRLKSFLWGAISESLDRLRERFDVVVIEGAGSPAEINLRDRDLVNMEVALYCDSPVLLAADIDRGGVFASLIGTMQLLEESEKEHIKAFIINKFRGDISLLKPGLAWLENRTGVPVAGVIPYYHDIYIPEEDSMPLEKRRAMKQRREVDIDIAVIALPHIANFDDFDPLEREAGVGLRYVEAGDDLGNPDLIILPGTKTTVADLAYLKETARDQEILGQVAGGTPIIGICAGYQMLGLAIHDPDGIESPAAMSAGLSLLPVTSRFVTMKAMRQISARVLLDCGLLARAKDIVVRGYEIHMGLTTGSSMLNPFEVTQRGPQCCADLEGCMSPDGNLMGTYIHGLFHNDDFRWALLHKLAAKKGKEFSPLIGSFSIEEQYDRLAAHVRDSLDMGLIQRLIT
jgi:adenosylcobyric acid synthase